MKRIIGLLVVLAACSSSSITKPDSVLMAWDNGQYLCQGQVLKGADGCYLPMVDDLIQWPLAKLKDGRPVDPGFSPRRYRWSDLAKSPDVAQDLLGGLCALAFDFDAPPNGGLRAVSNQPPGEIIISGDPEDQSVFVCKRHGEADGEFVAWYDRPAPGRPMWRSHCGADAKPEECQFRT